MAKPRRLGQWAAQGLVLCAVLLSLLPLFQFLLQHGNASAGASGIWPVVTFTLKQGLLSTLLSLLFGAAVARALQRQDFWGKELVLQIFALPMAMPAIVAVLGLVALFGNAGLLPGVVPLYGFWGIVLAHVFFNMPMCARLFYQALDQAPEEAVKLAAQLNLNELQHFRHVEWPVLKPVVPRVAALVFLLCAASFVIALSFGGASATTLEVAIYQSLRMDLDVPRALQLSLVQVGLSLGLIWLVVRAFASDVFTVSLRPGHGFHRRVGSAATLVDWGLIGLAVLLVMPVVLAVFASGLDALHFTQATWQALVTSLGLGFASACVALLLGLPLARGNDGFSHLISLAAMILPPAVMATGWFILMRGLPDSLGLSLALIVAMNSLMALPYATASLTSGLQRITPAHERLVAQLALSGWARWRLVDWPLLRPQLAQAFLLAAVASMGDLTAILLFGAQGLLTLPSLLQAEMGHYRGHDAAGTAVLLVLLCGGLSFAAQAVGNRDAAA